MDARERLRLYLEQRRDLGESELILDSMSVEEVMRVLGAGTVGRAAAPSSAGEVREARPDASEPAPSAAPPADWRSALRALEPTEQAARPAPPRSDAERAPTPPGSAPTRAASQPPGEPPRGHAETPAASPAIALEDVPAGLVIGSAAHELFGGPEAPLDTLDAIAQAAGACTRCSLYKSAKNVVPGEGNPQADFVCVGEAPGANEDEQGRPFVGQSGQLLTKILAAINLTREDVFICNVLKHRPPGNRNPLPDEVAACSPYLVRQLELIRPKVVVALGTFAAQTLLQSKEPLGKLRGMIHRYYGVPLIVTYHPAALLRNPSWKRPTWEDVQLARRILDRASGA
ncbi:MAG: uracil-DNA glycosylase family protein [Gemmatimonadaceae bacterium]